MDKPTRLVIANVETCSEQPEAPPFLVLDPVIVADRVPAFVVTSAAALRSPPFVGDPLRPIGPRDPVPASPPGETKRRIVGQQPECFDRLGRLEQSDRPRRFIRSLRNGDGGVAGEADLLRGQGLDRKGGEDHVFDTETWIDSVEPLFEEG